MFFGSYAQVEEEIAKAISWEQSKVGKNFTDSVNETDTDACCKKSHCSFIVAFNIN